MSETIGFWGIIAVGIILFSGEGWLLVKLLKERKKMRRGNPTSGRR